MPWGGVAAHVAASRRPARLADAPADVHHGPRHDAICGVQSRHVLVAPILGAATDTLGRKLVLTGTLASVALVNGLVALHPSVPLLMVSKYISMMGTGLFFLSAGAILGDKYRKDPTKLAGASSLLFALVNGGFAVGIAVGSQLPGGLRTAFGVSAIGACLASLTCLLTVRESLPLEARDGSTARGGDRRWMGSSVRVHGGSRAKKATSVRTCAPGVTTTPCHRSRWRGPQCRRRARPPPWPRRTRAPARTTNGCRASWSAKRSKQMPRKRS